MAATAAPDPATYTVPEFAAIMGISERAAYRLCEDGTNGEAPAVPHFRLGRTIRISKAWVEGLLEGRYQLVTPDTERVTSGLARR